MLGRVPVLASVSSWSCWWASVTCTSWINRTGGAARNSHPKSSFLNYGASLSGLCTELRVSSDRGIPAELHPGVDGLPRRSTHSHVEAAALKRDAHVGTGRSAHTETQLRSARTCSPDHTPTPRGPRKTTHSAVDALARSSPSQHRAMRRRPLPELRTWTAPRAQSRPSLPTPVRRPVPPASKARRLRLPDLRPAPLTLAPGRTVSWEGTRRGARPARRREGTANRSASGPWGAGMSARPPAPSTPAASGQRAPGSDPQPRPATQPHSAFGPHPAWPREGEEGAPQGPLPRSVPHTNSI